jgi:hypothetical protein
MMRLSFFSTKREPEKAIDVQLRQWLFTFPVISLNLFLNQFEIGAGKENSESVDELSR